MSTHLRIAAGVCVLSTSFMIAGAGVAAADPDASGATGSTTPSAGSTQGPIGSFADNVRKAVENSLQSTVQGVTGTLDSITKPGQLQSSIPKSPKTTFGGSPTVYGTSGPSTTSGTTSEDTTAPTGESPAAPATDTAPAQQPATPVVQPAAPVVTAPSTTTDPVQAVVTPVSKAFNSVATTVLAVPGVVASLPTSATPVSDFLASIQNVLTSVGSAGSSLSTVPSDLASLIVPTSVVTTPSIGASTGLPHTSRVTTATDTPVWSALPELPALTSADALPGVAIPAAPPVAPSTIATTGSISGAANATSALASPSVSGKNDVLSQVEHAIGAFVATVSLTALAAVALPGILGLLTTCAAGIRVGYRQAKAGAALPQTAIARFVGSGPIGVVRSSSQVAMRSRPSRVASSPAREFARPRALSVVGSESSATRLLDKAV